MTGDATRRRRIAYLTYSTGEFDSRTLRMAESSVERGDDVVVYARWEPGLAPVSDGAGFRIVRAPVIDELAIPWLRGRGRRKLAAARRRAADAATGPGVDAPMRDARASSGADRPPPPAARGGWVDRLPARLRGTVFGAPFRSTARAIGRWRRRILLFPLRPIAWAVALSDVAEPADLWHGMWATSLPALDRLRALRGGRTIYDSRDLYLEARSLAGMSAPWKWLIGGLERRWARRADAVLTVNDAYAAVLERQLGIARPPVVRNTPARYTPPDPAPNLLRERLGLPSTTAVVLYQGGLMTERGIEQGMEAILAVPNAVLVLMGFGSHEDLIGSLARSDRYATRVKVIEPVPPAALLDWTASADVMLVAIQPTTLNHRLSTPAKLWEAIAAGVPVVASDLPGMAPVVRETGCGELVDPTDPADIARGIRAILELPAADRATLRARCRAAGETYAWERQTGVLFGLYDRLLAGDPDPSAILPAMSTDPPTAADEPGQRG